MVYVLSPTQSVFIALVATSFSLYDYHQANVTQNLKGWLHVVHKMSSCMGSYLHQCQYLLAALNLLFTI
jgi:hypothetical protein